MIDGLYQFLAKIGFNEPLHAPITHMPIGLVVGALVFFLVAIIFKKKNLDLSARHASILAFIFAFPTIILGVLDWIHFFKAAMLAPIVIKMVLAAIVLVVLGAGIIFGDRVKFRSITMTVVYAIAFIAVIGLGYFGAKIYPGTLSSRVEAPGSTTMSTDVKAGEAIFTASCTQCHPNGGNSLDPKLPLKTSKKLADKAAFIGFIRNPKMPDGSQGDMPGFSAQEISDTDAAALFAYVDYMAKKW